MEDILSKIENGKSKLIQSGIWKNKVVNQIHEVSGKKYSVELIETSQGVQFSGSINEINRK